MSEEPHPACLSSHIEFDKLDRFKTYATETYSYDADGNRISLKLVGRKSETPSDAWMAANHGIGLVRRPSQPAIVGLNLYAYVGGDPLSFIDPLGLAEIPNPNGVVPGGPWTSNTANRSGNYSGPKQPQGGRAQCQWVPPEGDGGSPGSDGYWKTNQPGQRDWQRFNQNGRPITPEEAHPGNRPSSQPPPPPPRNLTPAGLLIWGLTFSRPAY